jgi:hypothetical protein
MLGHGAAHAAGPFTMSTAVALPGADGGTEPRYTVTPDGKHYAIANEVCGSSTFFGTVGVWESDDGLTNWQLKGDVANQSEPTTDVDLVSMPAGSAHPGRLIAVELDFAGINFRISYSDDGGTSWTSSGEAAGFPDFVQGGQYLDTDRPWLATGPGDRAYLLFHNLFTGVGNHNMYVSTSTDDGASFATPTPVTAPPSQAYSDLQCADSGGPSNIFVNAQDGRVYVVWGTRSAPLGQGINGGGCLASVTGSFEVNVVAATRVWVATAPGGTETGGVPATEDATRWQQSMAVDDAASGQIVGMQLAPGAIDSAGNVYILYPESPGQYPDYDGAAIKLVHASQSSILAQPAYDTGSPPPASVWSSPSIVAPGTAGHGGAGHLLPHIVAGGPGEIDVAYFEGDEIPGADPPTTADWYLVAGQSLNAASASPTFTTQRVSYPPPPAVQPEPAYADWTASQMMGACGSGPAASVENGTICSRSTDVWGIASDNQGNLEVVWPSAKAGDFLCGGTSTAPPPCTTWVTSQIDGPTIGPQPGNNVPDSPWAPALIVAGLAVAALGVRGAHRVAMS